MNGQILVRPAGLGPVACVLVPEAALNLHDRARFEGEVVLPSDPKRAFDDLDILAREGCVGVAAHDCCLPCHVAGVRAPFLQNLDDPDMPPTEKLALALSGWLMGSEAAVVKLAQVSDKKKEDAKLIRVQADKLDHLIKSYRKFYFTTDFSDSNHHEFKH